MRRKGPEASLDPVLSSTFMDRFLAAVFTTRRGSTCRDVALRNFGTGCNTLDCHSSHLSSTSALLWSWPPKSPPGVADRWVLWGSPRTAELLQQDVPGIGLAPAPGNRILNIAWKRIQLLLPFPPSTPSPSSRCGSSSASPASRLFFAALEGSRSLRQSSTPAPWI